MTFGELIKELRIQQKQSLRSFCEANGYDPGNHSKIERGILNPPDDEEWMRRMGNALHIVQDSADWFRFYDLATIAREQIPKPLMNDAEVVDKLPILFRTLQGDPLPAEKMDELIDFIRSRQ